MATKRGLQGRVWLWSVLLVAVLEGLLVPVPARTADAPNVAVTSLAHRSYQNYSMAQDPSNPQRLALTYVNGAYGNNNTDKFKMCAVALSDDAGRTWRREVLVGVAPAPGEPRDPEIHGRFPMTNTSRCRTEISAENGTAESPPKVVFGPDGTIYVVVALQTSSSRLKISAYRSRDAGTTYQGIGCEDIPVDCLSSPLDTEAPGHDKYPDVAVDKVSGQAYLVWGRFNPVTSRGPTDPTEEVLVAVAPNTPGQKFEFSQPARVPETMPYRASMSEQSIAVGPPESGAGSGRAYVTWMDPSEPADAALFGNQLFVSSSADGGQTFGVPVRLAQNIAPNACTGAVIKCEDLYYDWKVGELFSTAAGPQPGQVYVAWWERKAVGQKNRLYFRASTDAAKTFTSARIIGVPIGLDGHEQHRPWLSVAPNGRIDVVYYDISAPDSNGVRLHDVYVTSSCDNGATFTDPQRIRDAEPWNAAFGSPIVTGGSGHPDPYGDVAAVGRVAVASSNEVVSAAWTDGRRTVESGDPLMDKQDVFFGTVTPACGGGVLPTTTLPPTTLPPTTLPSTGTTTATTSPTTSSGATSSSASAGRGYSLVASDGGVFSFNFPFSGSTGNLRLNKPIVGAAADPDGKGYWMVGSDGGVFAFDAPFYGSTGNVALNQPIVAMAADPGGRGYYLVAADGGVFAFGPGARFRGSTGNLRLNKPIVAAAADRDGSGYWLFASDGGVFAFDAPYSGSTGNIRLAQPIVGAAADRDGRGYHLVASDGGVFAFDAAFAGSTGNLRLAQPVVAMATDPDGHGYWLVARDGGVFAFGATFHGSTGNLRLNQPIVAMAAG